MLSFPKRNTSPRGNEAIQNAPKILLIFVQLAKYDLWLLTKKKKVLCFLYKVPHENKRVGKPVERLRRKAAGPVIWQPAALSQPYRTWASPQGAVDSQSTKRRALYQPFGRCGALFALCGHGYILGVFS